MSNWKLVAGVALAAMAAATCERVPLTAAPGTTLTLIANPEFVAANGGRSLLTAILIEPAGTFVPDGTEVFFFTNLGSIADERAKTVNGVARTYFIADSRSGKAKVQAISGGPAVAPSASPSPAADPQVAADSGQATQTIIVGSANPTLVLVSASPQLLASSRQATIVANVFDKDGNPVQNVPVVFSVTAVPLHEFLASGGAPQFTDSNGQAFDTLSTRAPNGVEQKGVTVTATTPAAGAEGSVTVVVNYSSI